MEERGGWLVEKGGEDEEEEPSCVLAVSSRRLVGVRQVRVGLPAGDAVQLSLDITQAQFGTCVGADGETRVRGVTLPVRSKQAVAAAEDFLL